MNNKLKIVSISLISLLLVVFLVILFLYINFRSSERYGAYQLTLASKNHDAQLALKYHNLDKIVDNQIARIADEIDAEDDEIATAVMVNLLSGIKDALPARIKKDLTEEYEKGEKKLDNMSVFKIFYLAYSNKPVSAKMLKREQISKNKVKQSFCNDKGHNCYVRVWEKEKGGWKVADILYTD